MNINAKRTMPHLLTAALLSVLTISGLNTAIAAPISDGTLLAIEPGVGSGSNIPCAAGSCFAFEVAPNFWIWTDITPGTDGGIILGKNQASGGQELAPSASNNTSGEMTAAHFFFGNFGTFSTAPSSISIGGLAATENFFDAASCSGAGCLGNTELRVFHWNWNSNFVPFGSAEGCKSVSCSAEQTAGILLSDWVVQPDFTYALDYGSSVADGSATGFGGIRFRLHLAGQISVFGGTNAGFTLTPAIPHFTDVVSFSDTSSSDAGAIISWAWNFGDGSTSTLQNPTHTFTNSGSYNLSLTITDEAGNTDTRTRLVTVTNNAPVAADTSLNASANGSSTWLPIVADTDGDPLTCEILPPPPNTIPNGIASVATDCSSGTYTPVDGFTGFDSFVYLVSDGDKSSAATVQVSIGDCVTNTPIIQITLLGGGQSPAVNASLQAKFTGRIVSSGSDRIEVCAGTRVDYTASSFAGSASCKFNGTQTSTDGTFIADARDTIICTNKPIGSDTDRFRIKGVSF